MLCNMHNDSALSSIIILYIAPDQWHYYFIVLVHIIERWSPVFIDSATWQRQHSSIQLKQVYIFCPLFDACLLCSNSTQVQSSFWVVYSKCKIKLTFIIKHLYMHNQRKQLKTIWRFLEKTEKWQEKSD